MKYFNIQAFNFFSFPVKGLYDFGTCINTSLEFGDFIDVESLLQMVTCHTLNDDITVKPHPEAHMDMILFEVFLRNIHLIPQDQIVQWHYLNYNINSAVVISVVVESSRCSSKTLKKGSCPYAPLDEALRYILLEMTFPCKAPEFWYKLPLVTRESQSVIHVIYTSSTTMLFLKFNCTWLCTLFSNVQKHGAILTTIVEHICKVTLLHKSTPI